MTDRELMMQALALAALGEGTTRPNPMVGCLVVADGDVVGRGFHHAAGEPHAEQLALVEAGSRARDATLYVNLEPCAHQGRTAPCADAIVRAGVRRVVASIIDPNPAVHGRGFAVLRAAGIEVSEGALASQARALNAPFLATHERRRPWVTLKLAQSLDGRIAAASGSSTWVTGEAARRYAHRLRFVHDAVLVGAGTVRRDDPHLTIRLPNLKATPRRVVLAEHLRVPAGANVFRRAREDAPRTLVYSGPAADAATAARVGAAADVVPVAASDEGLDLLAVLEDLRREGVQSVLVEGGGITAGAFLRAGLVDRIVLFVAPRLFGALGATPAIDLPAVGEPARAWHVELAEQIPLGRDTVVIGSVART